MIDPTQPDAKLREELIAHLERGADHWITREAATHWQAAIIGEWDRVKLWRSRNDPRFGSQRPYSWLGAVRVVAENTPAFDAAWAEAFQ